MVDVKIDYDDFLITTDKNKMDVMAIHEFLSIYSTWSENISLEKVIISVAKSLQLTKFKKMDSIDINCRLAVSKIRFLESRQTTDLYGKI